MITYLKDENSNLLKPKQIPFIQLHTWKLQVIV